jgi:hypothetical protein
MADSRDYYRESLERIRLEGKCLERKLAQPAYQILLENLQENHSVFQPFPTWGAVLGFMNEKRQQELWEDQILRPIFQAYRKDNDPRWQEILLALFWPKLELIHRWKNHWDRCDPDRLWQNIHCTFLHIIEQMDVDQRRERLVQKVRNDIIHRVYEEYERTWQWEKRHVEYVEEPMEANEIDPYLLRMPLASDKPSSAREKPRNRPLDPKMAATDPDLVNIELRNTQQAAVQWLEEFAQTRKIRKADVQLYIGTQIYGKPLAECAEEYKLTYEAAKKRCQRMREKIRQWEMDTREVSDSCPRSSGFPPFYVESLMLER